MGNKRFGKWHLKSQHATLNWQALELDVDLTNPASGAMFKFSHDSVAQSLFAVPQVVVPTSEKLDPYARGRDLIASYSSSSSREIGTELYWRWAEFPDPELDLEVNEDETESIVDPIGTLELIYSLETLLLDTRPDPQVRSVLAGRSYRLFAIDGEGSFLEVSPSENDDRPAATVACLIENGEEKTLTVVMPSDLTTLNVAKLDAKSTSDTGNLVSKFQLDYQLNASFLEKGVIRRLRLFACWGVGDCEAALVQAAEHFLQSEIPLTA